MHKDWQIRDNIGQQLLWFARAKPQDRLADGWLVALGCCIALDHNLYIQ